MTLANRIVSALLALGLLLGGLIGAAEILLAQLGRSPWLVPHQQWSAWLAEQNWESTTIRSILGVALVVGVLLLVVAVRRGKPALVQLPSEGDPAVRVSAARRGLEKSVADAARQVDGVRAASASAGRRQVTVTAAGPSSSPQLAQDVGTAVGERLEALGLAQSHRSRIRIVRQEHR